MTEYINGVAQVDGDGATKEFFVPATATTGGTISTFKGDYAVVRLDALYDKAYMSFWVPNDFTTIISAEIIVIPRASQATADWKIYSDYAAVGEAYNANSEAEWPTPNVTNEEIFAHDVSDILDALAAGDIVGIQILEDTAGHNVDVIGLRFRYS